MVLKIRQASKDMKVVETVDINTIEELITLEKKYNSSLIFGTYWCGDDENEYSILVYDDYIE